MSAQTPAEARPCVVVGAGLAGLRACEGLRKGGYDGEIVVIGAEEHLPYNRPPLSKTAIVAEGPLEPDLFRLSPAVADVTWLLGDPVVSSDLTLSTVTTQSGQVITWSGLVVASGLRPRELGLPGPSAGLLRLRSLEDAARIRAATTPGTSVVVVGAGFIGCELAVTLSSLGADVHLVDPAMTPMAVQLGPVLGEAVLHRLLEAGVTLHVGTTPVSYLGSDAIESVGLSDGSIVPASLVVEAVGSVSNTAWLDGNGLDLRDGVLCDSALRVEGRSDIVVCGDIARFPHPLRGAEPRRMEHWTHATDSGRLAGRNLAAHLTGQVVADVPLTSMPSFWSDLGTLRIQGFGFPMAGMSDVRVLEGEPLGEVAVGYHRDGLLVGVVLLGLGSRYQHFRGLIDVSIKQAADRAMDLVG